MLPNINPLRSAFFLLLALAVFCSAAEIPCEWTGVQKIIAVGDLHGDYDSFVQILKNPKVGLVDDNLHWIGGKTHLVQIGDVIDRGDKAKEIYDLLMRLQDEAEAAGGEVHFLIGNHEEAAITGISLGYPDFVSTKQFVSFLPEDFREAREKDYFSRLPEEERAKVQALGGDLDKNPHLLNFWADVLSNVRKHIDPKAAVAYIENFNRTYGKWIQQQNSVIKINDTVFTHGGINLKYSTWKIKDINKILKMELGAYRLNPVKPLLGGEPFKPEFVYNQQSPLWSRQNDITSQSEIDEILANLGASRIVVGHSFLGSGAESPIVLQGNSVARFDNKVWMIDTGIGCGDLGGFSSALTIEDGEFNFLTVSPAPAAASAEANPASAAPQTPEEIEEFLKLSTPMVVVPGAPGRTEPWRVRLESNGITRWAQFKYINRPRPAPIPDSFNYEIAAYKLDKHLGLNLVPPAVPRTIKETAGSLQMFVENAIRESDRKKENIMPIDPEAFDQAMADLKVFVNLVYDTCENDRDILIQKETGKIYRVDFSEAFAPENSTIPGCEVLRCSRRLYQRLCDWDQGKVTALLEPYLNEEEIRALHARQGQIVRMIQEQIKIRGETAVLF